MSIIRPLLLSIAIFILLTFMAGCQNSPGGIASPKTDVHVTGIDPSILAPEGTIAAGQTDASQIKLPYLTVKLSITNGVSAFFDSALVNFYTQDGKSLGGGNFDTSLAFSQMIKAASLDQTTTTTTSGASGNEINLEVFSYKVFNYMTNGTFSNQADDLTPVIAKITLRGRDVNDNVIQLITQTTLSTLSSQQ